MFKAIINQAIFLATQPEPLLDPVTERQVLWVIAGLIVLAFIRKARK